MTLLETGGSLPNLQQHTRFLQAVAQHLGPDAAAYLATPSPTPDGASLAWTTARTGNVARFDTLDPQARTLLVQRFTALYATLDTLAQTQNATVGQDWPQMQRFADTSALWLVGDQPVLTRWGLPGLPASTLFRPAAAPPALPVVWPFLRHAPHLMPLALVGSGLGLIAAALLFWRIAKLFPLLCAVPTPLVPPALPAIPPAHIPPITNSAAATDDARLAHEAGGHSGKLEIILTWHDRNDLDLHVVTPNEAHIFFKRRAADGGILDLDANQAASQAAALQQGPMASMLDGAAQLLGDKVTSLVAGAHSPAAQLTDHPVEHVTWQNAPPAGHYSVQVNPYAMPYAAESPYHVSVLYNGQPLKSENGIAKRDQNIEVAPTETTVLEFDIPG